jgi:hypothetical protein
MRIFNRYFSLYDLIMVLGMSSWCLSPPWLFVRLSRSWRFRLVPNGSSGLSGGGVTLIVVISFYYSDLYAIDQTLSIRELFLRLMSGVGLPVSNRLLQLSDTAIGKTFYASQMAVMVISLCAWQVGL